MKLPSFIFDVDYTLYNSKDIPEEENDTEDITELFYSLFRPKKNLYELLEHYMGKQYLFSNGNLSHVNEVITKIGLQPLFSENKIATLDDYIERPKPYVQSYKFAIKKFNIQPLDEIYFFEDNLDNLKIAKQKYHWNTIYIDEDKTTKKKKSHYSYVDYTFKDIIKALTYLTEKIKKKQAREKNKSEKKINSTKYKKTIHIHSPKISPRRKRNKNKNKIDEHFSKSNMEKKTQRINKTTIRSPFRHRNNRIYTHNYINQNRIHRQERLQQH